MSQWLWMSVLSGYHRIISYCNWGWVFSSRSWYILKPLTLLLFQVTFSMDRIKRSVKPVNYGPPARWFSRDKLHMETEKWGKVERIDRNQHTTQSSFPERSKNSKMRSLWHSKTTEQLFKTRYKAVSSAWKFEGTRNTSARLSIPSSNAITKLNWS